MSAILEFLESIGNFFSNIWDSMLNSIIGQQQANQMIVDFVSNLSSYLAWIPFSVREIIELGLAICCLFILIGRC